jgi:hypothetical protein
MKMMRIGCGLFSAVVLLFMTPVALVAAQNPPTSINAKIVSTDPLTSAAIKAQAPATPEPQWLSAQKAARVVTYTVVTRGVITADLAEFKSDANQTLNDQRGWASLGIRFEEVASGGMLTLALSEASQVPSFSSFCDTQYSCTTGNTVVINQDRWLNATVPWNQAGMSLRDYRHLVINHETGHWLGHPDTNICSGAGQPAPVMAQQSITTSGCAFNAWPLASERWSSRLGINA